MPVPLLRVASRGSKLALWQARHVLQLLPKVGLRGALHVITTSGDRLKDKPLYDFGGKGLFAKEIETALLQRRVDIAVHSLKDMPVQMRAGLTFVCVLQRASPGDVLICQPRYRAELGETHAQPFTAGNLQSWRGRTIATGSLRRRYLLEQAHAGVKVQAVRGNVDTRVARLREGHYDALLLAQASVQRLSLEHLPHRIMDTAWYVPSCAQGAIAVQSRGDCEYSAALQQLNCAETRQAVMLERAIIAALGGSCALPFGCHVRLNAQHDRYLIDAVALSPTGRQARTSFSVISDTAERVVVAETVRRLQDNGLVRVLQELGLLT